jgi:hypothetical protein
MWYFYSLRILYRKVIAGSRHQYFEDLTAAALQGHCGYGQIK